MNLPPQQTTTKGCRFIIYQLNMKTATVVLIFSLLAMTTFAWQTEEIEIYDIQRARCDNNCAVCSNNTCTQCKDGYYLTPTSEACESCSTSIDHCIKCSYNDTLKQITCEDCQSSYDLIDNQCKQEQSSSTVIIIVSIVGGVVLIGAGIAVWRCLKNKKKKASTLLDQADNELDE